MSQETIEHKNQKGLLEATKFCAGVDILLLIVWIFYNNLSQSFISSFLPGIVMTLLFSFIICVFSSLVYALQVKKLSWMAVIPLLTNITTTFVIMYLIQIKNR